MAPWTWLACAAALAASPSPGPSPSPDPAVILERAIKAMGGEPALRRATVLKWRGRAMVHAGESVFRLEGRWIVEPPDRAVVSTWEVDKGESSTRRLVLLGSAGWTERDGTRTPMPAQVLANERVQFYLYSVMRLLPLREPGVRLTATGPRSLRVERDGRPPVEVTFDGDGWIDRLRTQVPDPESGREVEEVITFEGAITAGGVHWPLRLAISREGAPFFDLELTDFGIGTAAELEKEAARH